MKKRSSKKRASVTRSGSRGPRGGGGKRSRAVVAPKGNGGKRSGTVVAPKAVTAAELRALRREIEQRMKPSARRGAGAKARGPAPMKWNPDPEDVQRSVAQLVLTIVEFLRKLMERQAIRRMEQKTLTAKEVEAVGLALMKLEETVRDIAKRFGITPEELNLDLGPVGKLM